MSTRVLYVQKLGQVSNLSTRLVLCGTFLETFNFNFLGMAGYALGEEANSSMDRVREFVLLFLAALAA